MVTSVWLFKPRSFLSLLRAFQLQLIWLIWLIKRNEQRCALFYDTVRAPRGWDRILLGKKKTRLKKRVKKKKRVEVKHSKCNRNAPKRRTATF